MRLLCCLALPVLVAILSGCVTLKTPTFADDDGAIRGYDPVAYHLAGEPVRGLAAYSTEFNNATWYFSNQQNLRLFKANPAKYAPQYGGYCAYAMSGGRVVSTDPQAWHIKDGKLYLNYSLGVRRTWLKDTEKYIERADAHWADKIRQTEFE